MHQYTYHCRSCGETFKSRARTIPGPSLLACNRCGHTTAIRQNPWPVGQDASVMRVSPSCVAAGSCGFDSLAGNPSN